MPKTAKAYRSKSFLSSPAARPLRILSEYLEPKSRFDHYKVEDTIVFYGSARIVSAEQAEQDFVWTGRMMPMYWCSTLAWCGKTRKRRWWVP